MKRPVLKVAKNNYSVNSEDPLDFLIDSTKNQFKVLEYGSELIDLNSGNGYAYSLVIQHNLGYVPYILSKMNNKFEKSGSDILIVPKVFNQLPVFTQPIFEGDSTQYAFIFGSYERDNNSYTIKIEESDKMIGSPVYYDIEDINLTYYLFTDKQLEI